MQIIDMMRADAPVADHRPEWFFFRSYVAAALWSTNDESDDAGGEPLDSNYDLDDLSDETRFAMLADCASFYDTYKASIHCEGAPLSSDDADESFSTREASQAGHDFWLTRCGHGCGFLDGDWPEPAATILDEASKEAGNVDLYVGDDGLIYHM